jgi:hypothetical protein
MPADSVSLRRLLPLSSTRVTLATSAAARRAGRISCWASASPWAGMLQCGRMHVRARSAPIKLQRCARVAAPPAPPAPRCLLPAKRT